MIGIRIQDGEKFISVSLHDILEEIEDGKLFYWFIAESETILKENSDDKLCKFVNIDYGDGLSVSWPELLDFSKHIQQEINFLLIGSKTRSDLKKYQSTIEMIKNTDFAIEMFDSSWWNVYAKDPQFLKKLNKKFNKVHHILGINDQDIEILA